jgi:uncharacterized protein (DUF885 family)
MLIKISFNNYKKINKELLSLINKSKFEKINTANEKISKTDWTVLQKEEIPYVEYFAKILSPALDKALPMFNSKIWKVANIWFQQYKKGDYHNFHAHQKTNFSAVYYVELPKNSETKFYNNEKILVKEGDLIIFPGFWYHKSEPLKEKRKTIISFNCDFFDFTE